MLKISRKLETRSGRAAAPHIISRRDDDLFSFSVSRLAHWQQADPPAGQANRQAGRQIFHSIFHLVC